MRFSEYANLNTRNTMQLPSTVRYLAEVNSVSDLHYVLSTVTAKRFNVVILGDASNMLLPQTLNALVILPKLKGIRLLNNVADQTNNVIIEAMAGENWHQFVQYTVSQGWYGLENLSLIPGTVGASPVQNIGAYGVEVADRIVSLDAINITTGQQQTFNKNECKFAYRDSFFKQQTGKWVITAVRFNLSRSPQLVLNYLDIADAVGKHPTPQSVAKAICHIRQQKLPDPAIIPNAGSFFKNPIMGKEQLETLKQKYPHIPCFNYGAGYKVAAGWLIDTMGFKGKVHGAVSMYAKQALVMVNLGNANLAEVLQLQTLICDAIWQKFSIKLEREPIELSSEGFVI